MSLQTYTLHIMSQYSENYAAHNSDWNGTDEFWKDKGGVEFVIKVNEAERMWFSNQDVIDMVKEILAEKSNKHVKYEFVDMEYVNDNPEDLTEKFKKLVKKKQ